MDLEVFDWNRFMEECWEMFCKELEEGVDACTLSDTEEEVDSQAYLPNRCVP
jgi:hypothetical protein